MSITKNQLKILVDDDPKLGWWMGVLMGEICEIVEANKNRYSDAAAYLNITYKVEEVEQLIIQRATERAEENLKKNSTSKIIEQDQDSPQFYASFDEIMGNAHNKKGL